MDSDELFDLVNLLHKFRNDYDTKWMEGIDLLIPGLEKEVEKQRNIELQKKGIKRRSPF